MGGLRLILVVAALWVLYRLVRAQLDAGAGRRRRIRSPERMVRCEHCDVHVPASEAVERGGHVFCGEAHALDYERDRGV